MCIGQICNRKPITCSPGTSIPDLVALMREKRVGSVLVIQHMSDGQRICGIVTDRDVVVKLVAAGVDLTTLVAGDVATQDVVVAHQDDSIGDAIHVMRENEIKRLPVVDKRGCLIGIVSADDLLVYLANEVQELAAAFIHDQGKIDNAVARRTA